MKRLLLLVALGGLLASARGEARAIAIQWAGGLPEGRIVVDRGRLVSLRAERGEARDSGEFRARAAGFRLEAVVEGSTAPDNRGAAGSGGGGRGVGCGGGASDGAGFRGAGDGAGAV